MKHSFNILKCLGILLVYSIFLSTNTFASKPTKRSTIEADSANIVSQELIDKYIEVGSKRLAELMAMNEINDRNGESYKNSYVIDYASALNVVNDPITGKPYIYKFPPKIGVPKDLTDKERDVLESKLTSINSTIPVANGRIYVGVNMWLGEIYNLREPIEGELIAPSQGGTVKSSYFAHVPMRATFDSIYTKVSQEIKVGGVLPKCVILSYAQYTQHTFITPSERINNISYTNVSYHISFTNSSGLTLPPDYIVDARKIGVSDVSTEVILRANLLAKYLGAVILGKRAEDFKQLLLKKYPNWSETKIQEIAEFINANESMYDMYINRYKYSFDDSFWNGIKDNATYLSKLNTFYTALQSYKTQDCNGGLDVVLSQSTPSANDIVKALKCCYEVRTTWNDYWQPACFASVSYDNKLKMIKVLTATGIRNGFEIESANTAKLVISIVKSITTRTEQQKLLKDLVSTTITQRIFSAQYVTCSLLKGMTNKSYGFENAELQEFLEVISPWIKQGYATTPINEEASVEEVTTAIKDKKYVYITSNLYSWESTNFSMTNDVKITLKSKRGFVYYRGGSPYIAYRNYETPALSPYDYIVIQFQNAETISGKTYEAGKSITVPALYAYMAADYGNDQIVGQKINLVINVALTFAGVAEVRAALKTPDIIRKVLAVTDLVVQTGDVAINGVLEPRLRNSDAGIAFLKSWTVFTMIYGGTSVVTNINKSALDAYIDGRKALREIPLNETDNISRVENMLARCLNEGGGCFLPNTPIATPTGLTPIQNIKIGSQVNSYDEVTQKSLIKTVTNVFTKTTNKIYDIIVGSDTLHATPEHPFYTNGKWTIAQNLRKGMNLLTLAGMLLPITQINAHDTLATVHNFEVQDAHTYYVGKQQTLVHNLCAPLTLCPAMRELIDATPTLKPHLTKIEQWAADANIGNELVLSLKEDIQAFNDIARQYPGNQAKIAEALDSWLILRKNNSKFVRNSGVYLNKFNDLHPDVKALVARFTDDNGSSTLVDFLTDCNDINFKNFVNDPQNISFVRQMLAHKKDIVVTDDQLELIAETILNKPLTPSMTKVESWINRSAGVTKFLEKTADGVFYGNRALTTLLKNTPNDAVTTSLLNGLGITNLSDYKIFNEVQLWVNESAGQFMKADIMLVKYAPNGTTIQEVILIENKLSAGTLLTVRQNVGVTTLKNGGTLKVKAPASSKVWTVDPNTGIGKIDIETGGKTIGANTNIAVASNKRMKISDGGNKNGAFNVSGLEPN